jgi:hypothetical protein
MAYNKLSTANLPEPDISPANDAEPRDYFETFLYTGNGGGLQVGDIIKKPADTTTISNSLVFNDNDSAYLSRTPSSGGSQTTFTLSCWVKRADTNTEGYLFSAANTSATTEIFYIQLRSDTNSNTLSIVWRDGSTTTRTLVTDRAFKNSATWDHFVVAVNTNESTDADKIKVYINGVLETNFSADSRSTLSGSSTLAANAVSTLHTIGVYSGTLSGYLDGYLAEYHFVDGTAHEPTDFGNFDANGIWIPKTVTGLTYGTNGFYLDFSDATSTTTLGEDQTANGNDWTLNNFATTDQVDDSPTNNFNTFSSSLSGVDLYEGNLRAVKASGATYGKTFSTIGMSSGKWYFEFYNNRNQSTSLQRGHIGVSEDPTRTLAANAPIGAEADEWSFYFSSGAAVTDGVSSGASTGIAYQDIAQIAIDMDAGKIWFGRNNTWIYSGDPSTGANATFSNLANTVYVGASRGTETSGYGIDAILNSGQNSSFAGLTTAQGNTDSNGNGDFYYTPPTGFLALSENNITVDDQNLESPDFVWIKNRDQGDSHQLYDSVRGVQKVLLSDPDAPPAEADAPNGLLDFNANGFTIGSQNEVNTLNEDYVAWTWKAGGTPSTITAGSISTGPDVPSIPSSVSANTESGFSIVSYTGNSTVGATIGHGLNQAPDFMIIKSRDDTNSWTVYSSAIGNTGALFLEGTAGTNTNIAFWNNTSPTSTVFTTHSNAANNSSSNDYIAYCFHSVDGFSKFGSYVGGGTSFPFVYTGFRPAFVMIKATSGSENWNIVDTMRDPFNGAKKLLFASATTVNAVATNGVDLLANGFKPRDNIGNYNSSGVTYIYMAFAENPFKYSNAR